MVDEFLSDIDNSVSYQDGSAIIRYILEYPLYADINTDEKLKEMIDFFKSILDVAARTNLKRNQVYSNIWEFDNNLKAYVVYKRRGKYDSDIIMLKRNLRQGCSLQLCRSIEGQQIRMIFEPIKRIVQNISDSTNKKIGFFKKNKSDKEEE